MWRRAGLHQFRSGSTSSATDTYRARAPGVSLHKHDSLSLSAFIKMEFLKLPFIFLTGVPSIDLGAGCNSRPLNDSVLGHSSRTVLRQPKERVSYSNDASTPRLITARPHHGSRLCGRKPSSLIWRDCTERVNERPYTDTNVSGFGGIDRILFQYIYSSLGL